MKSSNRQTLGLRGVIFVLGLLKVALVMTFFFFSVNLPPFNTALLAFLAWETAADFLTAILHEN